MTVSPNGTAPTREARRLGIVQSLRLHPFLSAGVPLALVGLTLAFVLWTRPLYEATTSIRIDEKESPLGALGGISTLSGASEVFTEMAVLKSRTLAEDVVNALALQVSLDAPKRTRRSTLLADLVVDPLAPEGSWAFERGADGRFTVSGVLVEPVDQPRPFQRPRVEKRTIGDVGVGERIALPGVTLTLTPAAADLESFALSVAPFPRAVRDLVSELVVSRPDREAGVVVVRYRGRDPELVQRVPNVLARSFIEGRQRSQSAQARGTVTFLHEQIDTLGLQLAAAEEALRSFREANQIVSPEAGAEAQVTRLAEMQAQRDQMIAERDALGGLLAEVRQEVAVPGQPSPFRKLVSFPSLIANTASAEMLGQLTALENQRAELQRSRTATNDRDIVLLDERIASVEGQLRTMVETYWRGLGERVRTLGAGLAGFEGELARIPREEMNYIRMRRTAELLSDLYTLLETKQKEAEISAAVLDQSVRVVDTAVYPTEPIRPQPWLSLFAALAIGLVMGVGGAVGAEHLDRTVRDRDHLQAASGAAVLGLIPVIGGGPRGSWLRMPGRLNGAGRPRLVEHALSGDPAAEAYRSLRTNISFARSSAPPRAMVFTSPMPGDGKSTTAANLALVLAQQGRRTVLVDADMRRGSLQELFRERREPGLANLLAGGASLADVVRRVQLEGGAALDFIPCGIRPPNPAELLTSPKFDELVRQLGEGYDAILFDAPPLNLVTDAALVGTRVDGVILVARAGVTEAAALAFAVDQIGRVRATLLGTVLNGVDERGQGYYGSQGGGAKGYFAQD